MHETTFTVKQRHSEYMNKSFDEGSNHPKSYGKKVVFEQRDSITLPKFLLGNKKKSVPAPVSRPQLATTPTNGSGGANALRSIASEDGGYISPTVSNVNFGLHDFSYRWVILGIALLLFLLANSKYSSRKHFDCQKISNIWIGAYYSYLIGLVFVCIFVW